MTKFERLVLKMRTTQKEYFRLRDKDILAESKKLEKEVDDWLKVIEKEDNESPTLF